MGEGVLQVRHEVERRLDYGNTARANEVTFVEENDFGVVDHYVTPAPEVEVYVPMRVLSNGSGSEVIFTLFRLSEMSDEQFAEDVGMVERDLETLKIVLES